MTRTDVSGSSSAACRAAHGGRSRTDEHDILRSAAQLRFRPVRRSPPAALLHCEKPNMLGAPCLGLNGKEICTRTLDLDHHTLKWTPSAELSRVLAEKYGRGTQFHHDEPNPYMGAHHFLMAVHMGLACTTPITRPTHLRSSSASALQIAPTVTGG